MVEGAEVVVEDTTVVEGAEVDVLVVEVVVVVATAGPENFTRKKLDSDVPGRSPAPPEPSPAKSLLYWNWSVMKIDDPVLSSATSPRNPP